MQQPGSAAFGLQDVRIPPDWLVLWRDAMFQASRGKRRFQIHRKRFLPRQQVHTLNS